MTEEDWSAWIGRSETATDTLTPAMVETRSTVSPMRSGARKRTALAAHIRRGNPIGGRKPPRRG